MPAFTPMYRRIIADLKQQIDRGQLPPGRKLPSTRELAEHYGVSRGTVRDAINRLLDAGVLRGHMGLGVFVAGPGDEKADGDRST